MQYQRNQFFSVKKPKEKVTFLHDEKDDKQKDPKQKDQKKKEDAIDAQEIELEEKKDDDKAAENEEEKNDSPDKKAKDEKSKPKKPHFKKEELKKVQDFNKAIDANSLLRRWDVKFLDIKAENLQKEAINIFLVFKIGEKTKLTDDEIKQLKRRGEEYQDSDMIDNSKSFKQFKTEIIKEIEKESQRKVKKSFEAELHASYNMMRQRNLKIEVWEYSRWSLNKYLGAKYIKLDQLASSSIHQQIDIRRAGKSASFLRLYLICYIQEIWDFRMDFENLKGFNTINKSREGIPSYLKLTLMDDSNPSVRTQEVKETVNPNWGFAQDFIHYRGTMDDLTDKLLQLTVVPGGAINIGLGEDKKTQITLRGIHRFNSLSASIRIKLQNEDKQTAENYESPATEYTYVEGRVNLNQIPRYIQTGELVRYKKDQHYLCIVINRVSHISAPDDRGLINSYVVIQCGNEMKQTRTIIDQMNPDFNEEMVFKIPVQKSTNFLDLAKNLQNIVQNQGNVNLDSMRDELTKRSEVKFSLWVEGNQITSDDNLGYASFNISEIAQSYQMEEKEIVDFETKQHDIIALFIEYQILFSNENNRERIKHKIKVGNFTKSFVSSRFDASRINVSFLAFFIPSIPESIDLRDFFKLQGDVYPYDLKDKMKIVSNDYQSNEMFQKRWENSIKNNFLSYKLKKNEIAIFLKNIWVKDQYNKLHFISKFVDNFSILDMSYEDVDESEKLDTALETMQDLAHYTRCIPFVENDYTDIWYSPDFFLSLRRGSIIDHAILMAGLFMGSGNSKKQKEDTKEKVSIEDRVFVCLGTNEQENIVAWVMVYDKDFKYVTFWDVKDKKKWDLENRVEESQIKNLQIFLNPSNADKNKLNIGGLFKFLDKKEREKKKKEKAEEKARKQLEKEEELKREEIQRQQEEDERNEIQKQQQELQKVFAGLNQQEPKNESSKNTGLLSVFNKDDNIKQNQIFSAEEVERGTVRRTQVKGLDDVATQHNSVQAEPPKKSTIQADPYLQSQINDRKTFKQAQMSIHQPKASFFEQHKEQMIQNQEQDEATKFKKVEEFNDEPGKFDDMPYKSVQIIFNHKNVYANFGNQNPVSIFYNLHEPKKWFPYFEKNNQKLGSFYLPSNPYPKMSKAAADNALEQILGDIKDGINNMRSNDGLQTQWKSVLDPTSKLLKHYARILEYQDKEKKMKIVDPKTNKDVYLDFDDLYQKFEKDMKNLMPTDYNFQCLPMKFLFIEKSQIRALIEEKGKQFFQLKKKHIIFGINGKIFRYPNKINCLRIVIAIYYSNLDAIQNEKDKPNIKDEPIKEEQEEDSEMNGDEDMDDLDESANLKKSPKKSNKI